MIADFASHSPGERTVAPGGLGRTLGTGLAWATVLAVATLPAYLYLRVWSGRPVHVSGSDAFGYAWQMRVLGAAPVKVVGARPGVAGLGSVLQALHVLPPDVAPVVLGIAMGAALALACAALLRIAFGLPAWTVGVVAVFVAMWTGTARMGAGYLANLVSITAFVAAMGLIVLKEGRGIPMLPTLCALASGLAHPGFLPVYVGIVAVWGLISLPAVLRDRGRGSPWLRSAPVLALASLAIAIVVVAFLLFVIMGLRPADVADFQVQELGSRLGQTADRILAPIPILIALLGGVVAWLNRGVGAGRTMCRLGLGWMAVSLGGALLGLAVASFPGHRALLIALPIPVAMGLGAVGAIGLVVPSRVGRLARVGVRALAVVAMAAVLIGVARPALPMYRGPAAAPPAMDVVAYVSAVHPDVPVVVVMEPPGLSGILFYKARLNEMRAFSPRQSIAQIVAYLGRPDEALAGRQTVVEQPASDVDNAFNRVSARLWREFGAQVSDPNSIVLLPREFVSPNLWDGLVAGSQGLATPDLAVLRGPVPGPIAVEAPPTVAATKAWFASVLVLLVLAIIGGGFASIALRSRGGKLIDVVAIAPALGAVALTLEGLAIALFGGDPLGAVGIVVAVLVASAGYAWAATRREPADEGPSVG